VTSFDEIKPGPVTASLVVSKAGLSINELGNSKGLGNSTDLQLLKWFRGRSQIVLTSGKTAAAEEYRYPSSAELAILSRSDRKYVYLENDLNRVRFLGDQKSYTSAVEALHSQGFERIHTEFGESGFFELVQSGIADGFVSSADASGITRFLESAQLTELSRHFFGADLVVCRVSGRGTD
jgi:riboflavin biosynthesis pyrimidine reductase